MSCIKRRRSRQAGFTLIEILIAMLVAMVGLLGTVAVQQSGMNAAMNVNDAQVAMRLAVTTMEQFNIRKTQQIPFVDMLDPIATDTWTDPVYLDSSGHSSATRTATARWAVTTKVNDTGRARPYNISVRVSYNMDSGDTKTVQLDVERRKTW